MSARWLLWNFRHLYLPDILVPPYFGRLCRVVDDDGDGGIVDGHEGGVLQLPCHHGFPHEGAFLGVDGLLCAPLFTMTGLDLYEIEDASALGDDVDFHVLVTPVASKYLEAAVEEVAGGNVLAPLSEFIVKGQVF